MSRPPNSGQRSALLTLLLIGVTVCGVLWPLAQQAAPQSSEELTTDPVQITAYEADLTVDDAGTLTTVETLDTEFPAGRRGIFRFFDVWSGADPGIRLVPKNIAITRDEQPDPVSLWWEQERRFRVARVGDPAVTLTPGPHRYNISFDVEDVLLPHDTGYSTQSASWAPPDPESSVFYWNVVAPGWQMPMGSTRSIVNLPGPATNVECFIGDDLTRPCEITGEGTNQLVVTTGELAPRTPVTLRAQVDFPMPARSTLPWAPQWDAVLGRSVPLLVTYVVLALAALGLGLWWSRRAKETPPGFGVQYAPPVDMGPAQSAYVMTEQVPGNALAVSVTHLAERGYATMTQVSAHTWVVERTAEHETLDGLDSVTRRVAEALDLVSPGDQARISRGQTGGRKLQYATELAASSTKSWALREGYLRHSALEIIGRVLVVLAGVASLVMFAFRPLGPTLPGAVFSLFVLGGAALLSSGVGTRRTKAGRHKWSEAGGFYRLLATPSAQDRFDFAANRDLYAAYIPYAMAFGCADAWARKYQMEVGEEPEPPSWYVPHVAYAALPFTADPLQDFGDSIDSSIASYVDAQNASSSGSSGSSGGGFSGGGFSSGSAGGGGGGGSW